MLWALAVLFLLFVGVILSIFKESFPLFRYSVVVVTVLYLALSFSHPDYIIAAVNVANAPESERNPFFLGEYYDDYRYLSTLSADAAPVLLPYMEKLGYDMSVMEEENIFASEKLDGTYASRTKISGFGYHYLNNVKVRLDKYSWRTFNVSRCVMLHLLK